MAFTKETFEYLADLEANNDKGWFEANRRAYEAHWKEAALDFIADVSGEMAALSPSLRAEPKLNKSLRRINRDVRFSKDKSPYNARLHMVFWTGGHPNRSPGLHVVLQPGGIGYGAGQFGLEPEALQRIRQRIAGAEGETLVEAYKAAEKVRCHRGEPDLARLPKGFEAEGERAVLSRHKAIVARTRDHLDAPGAIIGAKGKGWLLEKAEALMPLVRWLSE